MKRFKTIFLLIAACLLTAALLLSCTACTSAFSNLAGYFQDVGEILKGPDNSVPQPSEPGEEPAEKTPLAQPENFVVNADGTYSFSSVENAASYYLYLYDQDGTEIASRLFLAEDGVTTYSGDLNELFVFPYGSYDIAVVACASLSSDYSDSPAEHADYAKSGPISTPQIEYAWKYSGLDAKGVLYFQLYNAAAYANEITPDSVEITLTDLTDNGVQTVSFAQEDINTGSTQNFVAVEGLTAGHSYAATAVAKSSSSYVTNEGGESEVATVMTSFTIEASEEDQQSASYSLDLSGFTPSWKTFDQALNVQFSIPVRGGSSEMTMTPAEAADPDIAYYYTGSDGGPVSCTFTFYTDGTAVFELSGGPNYFLGSVTWQQKDANTITIGRLFTESCL